MCGIAGILGVYFGFKQKKHMELVQASSENIKITRNVIPKFDNLTAEEVKEHYKEFDIGPGTEICVGWSYIPLNYLTDKQGFWMYNEDAILLKMEHRNIHNSEVPLENEIWLIPYGKPKAVLDLIQYAVQKELETNESIVFEVFCKSEVADLLKKIGFNPYEDERLCVILFEKILN